MTVPAATGSPASAAGQDPLVRRTGILLRADPRRVVGRLFLPGQEPTTPGPSRAAGIVERALALDEAQAAAAVDRVLADYAYRHHDVARLLDAHFEAVAHRVEGAADLSVAHRRLLGAYFTQEYAVEGAALTNPSVVPHPQPDAGSGRLRFVMSARAIGEGHVSSIVFRTGVLDAGPARTASVTMNPASPHVTAGALTPSPIDREQLRREAAAAGAEPDTLAFVLAGLDEHFAPEALGTALDELHAQRLTRAHAEQTASRLRTAARGWYEVGFPSGDGTELSGRALMPVAPVESHGLEDARFVRFTEDDGTRTYLATYTAFDGSSIAVRCLRTDDFRTFAATPFTGTGATNKGMALFPRRIGGRYAALSRHDRENNSLTWSDDGHHWPDVVPLQAPLRPWELVQLGNCGSPVETDRGWVVLTHGVGPVREYAIGALLLDLDDPARVLGRLAEPLLSPAQDERDGYVPNVVYSCGALVHGDTLLLPYGCSDATIRLALVDVPALLDRLLDGS